MYEAASKGHVDPGQVLLRVRQVQFESSASMAEAPSSGHLDIARFTYETDLPWVHTCYNEPGCNEWAFRQCPVQNQSAECSTPRGREKEKLALASPSRNAIMSEPE